MAGKKFTLVAVLMLSVGMHAQQFDKGGNVVTQDLNQVQINDNGSGALQLNLPPGVLIGQPGECSSCVTELPPVDNSVPFQSAVGGQTQSINGAGAGYAGFAVRAGGAGGSWTPTVDLGYPIPQTSRAGPLTVLGPAYTAFFVSRVVSAFCGKLNQNCPFLPVAELEIPEVLSVLPTTSVTDAGIAAIEEHLSRPELIYDGVPALDDGPNQAAIARLKAGEITTHDLAFYNHELYEKQLMDAGMLDPKMAHLETLRWQGISYERGYEQLLYHPDIVAVFQSSFK
jgi:hypothetical protein